MSQFDQHQIPVAYPPPSSQPREANQHMPPPPVGYPTTSTSTDAPSNTHHITQTRGDGFLKGCCAAICCCCVLDACF